MDPLISARRNQVVTEVRGGQTDVGVDAASAAREEEFDVWVRPHLAALLAVAESQVGFTHRDDVVQETILRAWLHRATYRPNRGSPRAWLIGILMDQSKRHRTRFRQDDPWDGLEPASAPAETDDHRQLIAAVNALPRRRREVITLHYLADLSVHDIAQALDIRTSTVTSHLHAARRQLAADLGETEGES